MKLNVFSFASYKDYLKAYIKQSHRRGIVGDLAEAAGCDRTYLSQCMSSKVQLTPDHALGLTDYFRMTEVEESYFLLMLLKDRAATPKAKASLKRKMEQLRSDNQSISKKVKSGGSVGELGEVEKGKYYASWLVAAVHILTSVEKNQNLEAIAERLKISKKQAEDILQDLVELKLVSVRGSLFVHSGGNIHISKGSSYNILNHMHWRNKALEFANSKDSIHYTHVFGVSKQDWPKLKDALLQFIESQRESIQVSGSEDVYCFCCDLFSP